MSGAVDIDALPQVMGTDGEFHVTDEAVDLSGTPIEAWAALGFFWLLGLTVFTSSSRATCSTTRPRGPKKSRAIC